MANKIDELYFSQAALSIYDQCALKFKRRYLDGLYWGSSWGKKESQKKEIEKGRLFHDLADKYYSFGKNVVDKELIPEEVAKWLESLIKFRPYNEAGAFLPEQELRLNQDGMKLMAKFDLLYISSDNEAIIYDWKTSKKPAKKVYRRRSIQTKLYRYLLVAAGGRFSAKESWAPEEIKMVYWNPRFKVEQVLAYSQEKFEADKRYLQQEIKEIKNDEEFMATDNEEICDYCEYNPICHGETAIEVELEEEDLDIDFDWEEENAMNF